MSTEREDAAAIYNKISDIGSAYLCLHGDRFCAAPEYVGALHAKIDSHIRWKALSALMRYRLWRAMPSSKKATYFSFRHWTTTEEQSLWRGRQFAVSKLAELSAGIAVLNNMADNFKTEHGKPWRLGVTDDNMVLCLPPERGG